MSKKVSVSKPRIERFCRDKYGRFAFVGKIVDCVEQVQHSINESPDTSIERGLRDEYLGVDGFPAWEDINAPKGDAEQSLAEKDYNEKLKAEYERRKKKKEKKDRNSKKRKAETERRYADDSVDAAIDLSHLRTVPDKVVTLCDKETPDMQKRGEKFIPRGWGPNCNPNKDEGTAEAHMCYARVYMKAMKDYLSCIQQEAAIIADQAIAENEAREKHMPYLKRKKRGIDGVAYTNPFTIARARSACESVESRINKLLNKQKPKEPSEYEDEGKQFCAQPNGCGNEDAVQNEGESVFDECLKKRAINNGPDNNTTSMSGAYTTSVKSDGAAPPAGELGVEIGALVSCACTDCIVVTDSVRTEDHNTVSDDIEEDDNIDTGIEELTSEEDISDEVIPLAFGTNIVNGIVISFDEQQFRACASKTKTFDAVYRVAANKQAAVLRVLFEGKDVTDDVEFLMSTTKYGYTDVSVYNIPSAWARESNSVKLQFEIVEDYAIDINSSNVIHTQLSCNRMCVKQEHNRLWAIDTVTKELCEFKLNDLSLVTRFSQIIINDDMYYNISPTGDIVYRTNGSTDITIFSPACDKIITLNNVCNSDVTSLSFTTDGWIDMREITPYQLDTVRLNPAKYPKTWVDYTQVRKLASAYLIHFEGSTSEDSLNNCIAVPAHIADFDLTRKQEKFYPSERQVSGERLIWAFNEQEFNIRSSVYRSFSNITILDIPEEFKASEIYNYYTKDKVTPESGDTTYYGTGIDTGSTPIESYISLIISAKYKTITMFNTYNDSVTIFDYMSKKTEWFEPMEGFVAGFAYSDGNDMSPVKTLTGHFPVGKYENAITNDVYTFFIDKNNNIVRLDVANAELSVIGHIDESDVIISQKSLDGNKIVYETQNNIKYIHVYRHTEFDIGKATSRMFENFGIKSNVVDSIPSYISGFVVKDNVDEVVSNLYKITNMRVHFHNGDGTATITRGGPEKFNSNILDMYKKYTFVNVADSEYPSVEVSYINQETGERLIEYKDGDNDKHVTVTTNVTSENGYPLAVNAQIHSSERDDWNEFILPFGQSFDLLYDSIEIDIHNNECLIEHTNHIDEKLSPPDISTTFIEYKNGTPPVRPVLCNKIYKDISKITFCYLSYEDDMLIATVYGNIPNDANKILGCRNNEIIYFDSIEHIISNKYELKSFKRGAFDSEAAAAFNGNHNSGMFVFIEDDYDIIEYNDEYVHIDQSGREIVLPVQKQNMKNVPSPVNLTINTESIKWHSRGDNGTGNFILIFYWTKHRDKNDARYLFNTINSVPYLHPSEFIKHHANRFLHIEVAEGTNEIAFPTTLANEPLLFEDHFFNGGWDATSYGSGDNWFKQGYQIDKHHMDAMNEDYVTIHSPDFSKPPNEHLYSEEYRDFFNRVTLPYTNDMNLASDLINIIFDQEFPLLTSFYDYYGDPQKNDINQFMTLREDDEAELPDVPYGFKIPESITPFRFILENLLYPAFNREGHNIQVKSYSSYASPRNKYNIWSHQDYAGASFNVDFMERIEVVYYLLDQYYLGIPVPYEKYTLLEKYGVQPPYSLDVHDSSGVNITKFFNDTIKNFWHYQRLQHLKYINVLIAEEQVDGSYGHFAVYENIPVSNKDTLTCGHSNKIDTDGLKTRANTSYALIDATSPVCVHYSISYVVAPYTPPTDYIALMNTEGYVMLHVNRYNTYKTSSYAVLQSYRMRVNAIKKYVILKQ
jgi:hypothetical protein